MNNGLAAFKGALGHESEKAKASVTVVSTEACPVDQHTFQRVCGEFLEMPGLHLTCKQAQRLWGLDERSCVRLLEFLVDAEFLRRHEEGLYTRLTEGRVKFPLARIVTVPRHR